MKDSFVVPQSAPKADILVIEDTRGTMDTNMVAFTNSFTNFIKSLAGVDWQIAYTNSSVGTGALDGWAAQGGLLQLQGPPYNNALWQWIILPNDPYPQQKFTMSIGRGYGDAACGLPPGCSGSQTSQPLLAALTAMKNSVQNNGLDTGFFRPGANFVPVILTNQDENSGMTNATQAQTVTNYFNANLSMNGSRMVGYPVIVKPGDQSCYNTQHSLSHNWGGAYGNALAAFATATGGQASSICDSDHSNILANLAQTLNPGISSVTLSATPLSGSVVVTFTPKQSGVTWTVSGKQVKFSKPVPAGTQIDVTYQSTAK